ncbi:MAG: hypothetical protein WCK11_00930 [Candidatus Falkowbacteria bacterium]
MIEESNVPLNIQKPGEPAVLPGDIVQTPERVQAQIKVLLEQNLELTKEIHEMTHKIKRYITFQKVLSFIYLLLIFVPLIVGAIYLPPLLQGILGQYSQLMGGTGSSATDLTGILEQLKQGGTVVPK